jgi:formylglycine-generating enzyme required for sulfatase activity
MGNNPSGYTDSGTHCPVERVSWNDTQKFINQLNQLSVYNYRLPTEAEWEYAARSGGNSERYSGGNDIDAFAWYRENSEGMTHPVGQKRANGLGLYDMSGNISEWVYDRSSSYSRSSKTNPAGPCSGDFRVIRGGCIDCGANAVRASCRNHFFQDNRSDTIGFRLAASVQ